MIIITHTEKTSTKNRIQIEFNAEGKIAEYFKSTCFFAEYSIDISHVPDAVAVIPFITNVLPIIWLFDDTLYVDELDETFYHCLENIKKGYIAMYPEASFKGTVVASRLVDCSYDISQGNKTAFFSGGVDAVHTLLRHIDEKPDLITIWGSDLRMQDEEGWEVVKNAVSEVGKKYGFENLYIKSNFAEFVEERKLSYRFWDVIHGFWYHQIQHGIGMLGLIAPLAYEKKIAIHYIASSYSSKQNEKIECASDPSIDNELRFGSCRIMHDAFDYARQDKIHDIVQHCRENNVTIPLRVCWTIKNGDNCCRCEKCYRTIMGVIAEKEAPEHFGLKSDKETMLSLRKFITLTYQPDNITKALWLDIQRRFKENKAEIRKSPLYHFTKWILNFDFSDIKKNKYYKFNQVKGKVTNFVCRLMPRKLKDYLKKYIHID